VTFGPSPVFNTAVKYGSFSVSQDERDTGSFLTNLWDVIVLGRTALFIQMRKAMDEIDTFDNAVKFFSKIKLSAASYFILGGAKSGEGAVVTRDRDSLVDVWRLNASAGRWYVVETNYDHSSNPPKGDNRRAPLMRTLNATGPAAISAA